jgi:hypothetical protein
MQWQGHEQFSSAIQRLIASDKQDTFERMWSLDRELRNLLQTKQPGPEAHPAPLFNGYRVAFSQG